MDERELIVQPIHLANRKKGAETASKRILAVDPRPAALRLRDKSNGWGVAESEIVSRAWYDKLTDLGTVSPAGASLVARVAELEERGQCEPGLNHRVVLESCLVSERLRRGEISAHKADRDQIRLGMARHGAEGDKEFISRGMWPFRAWLDLMVGTAKSGAAVGATFCRGFRDFMEIFHRGSIEFQLPTRQRDRLILLSEKKSKKVRGKMTFEEPPDVIDVFTRLNIEFNAFLADCLLRSLAELELAAEEVTGVAAFPVTVRYTTSPHHYDFKTPEGHRIAGSSYGITDLMLPQTIAKLTGFPVVTYQRQNDIAAGNSGAHIAGALSKRELTVALERHDLNVGVDVNWGGQGNFGGLNRKTGASAANDLGIAARGVNWSVQKFSGADAEFDKDGYFARQGRLIPELEDRFLSRYLMLLRSGNKADTGDWDQFFVLVENDYHGHKEHQGVDVIHTISHATAKASVIGIEERAVPIIGPPEYCLQHGGLWNHLPTKEVFDREMRERFGTKVIEEYRKFRLGTENSDREQILCAFTAQEASVGHAIPSPQKNDAILGNVI